jgi:PAS domain S-box-containing protein
MNRGACRPNLSRSALAMLAIFVALSMTLLLIGFKDYPGLHTVCDTGMFLLSGLLAFLFWELGVRSNQQFPRYISISFAVTSVAEFVHAFVSIEWSVSLVPIAQAADVLRPTTWPPAAYLLPTAVGSSLWLMRRHTQRVGGFTAALVAVVIALFVGFHWLPTYTVAGWLGITRPSLILVPMLWMIVGWASWRYRASDRLLPILGYMAAVLAPTSFVILYSRSPHDAQGMVAHLGRIGAYLLVLFSVMQLGSSDMIERIKAERELARLNEDLERRVLERTAEVQTANDSLAAEIAVRQKTEAALRESHERTRAIVDTALDGIVTMDHEGRIAGFNPAAERIFGYSLSDVIGRPLADMIIPPAFREQHRHGLAHYLATGEARVFGKRIEVTGNRADGSAVDLELSIDRMPGDGSPLFAGFVRDITERKRAEQIRERLAAIVESSDDAIISKTLDGVVTAWNSGAQNLFGYSSEEMVGKPLQILVPVERASEEPEILARIARGESVDHFETVRIRKDGKRIEVSVTISPVKDGEGEYCRCFQDRARHHRTQASRKEG